MCLGLVEGVIGKIQLHTGKVSHKAHILLLGEGNSSVQSRKGVAKCVKVVCVEEEWVGSSDDHDSNTESLTLHIADFGWEKYKEI